MPELYEVLECAKLVGIMLVVFVKRDLFSYIEYVSKAAIPSGLGGFMGNKGGVCVRFRLRHTFMCFVNCHLAAGEGGAARRNQDFHKINREMPHEFSSRWDTDTTSDIASCNEWVPELVVHRSRLLLLTVLCSMTFWMGDMNYRVTGMSGLSVEEHLNKGNIDVVFKNDELMQLKANRIVFDGYRWAS